MLADGKYKDTTVNISLDCAPAQTIAHLSFAWPPRADISRPTGRIDDLFAAVVDFIAPNMFYLLF